MAPISANSTPRFFAGVMTGTSLDAIDVAILGIHANNATRQTQSGMTLNHFLSKPLDTALIDAMLSLQVQDEDELHRAALIANTFADAISRTVLEALSLSGLKSKDIVAIGVHGQTIRHQPRLGYTIQLNAPARIAEATGITVVSDFRSRDIAAGGQGAPLVPAFHRAIFQHDPEVRVLVNVGGIANITWLGRTTLGYDTGPGNILMDAWIRAHRGEPFDANGQWAATGIVHKGLLNAMLGDPFFSIEPPKSTGRDLFSMAWLQALLSQSAFHAISAQDVQATLLALTAKSIAKEIHRIENRPGLFDKEICTKLLVCGGGAKNLHLMGSLTSELEKILARKVVVSSTADEGWNPQAIEASAFAWLAWRTLDGKPGNVPSVTGAIGERILGSITPA